MSLIIAGSNYKYSFYKFAIYSSAIYFSGHTADLLITYILDPTLVSESNMLVTRYNFGWPHLILTSLFTTIVMLLVQLWMWRRLFNNFPHKFVEYKIFYRYLLFGNVKISSKHINKNFILSALMAIAFIVCYAAIFSKLLAVVWNLYLLLSNAQPYPTLLTLMLVKNLSAAGFGLFMFYIFVYWVYRGKVYNN